MDRPAEASPGTRLPPACLNYQPGSPRRPRVRRAVLALILLAVSAVFLWQRGPALLHAASETYWDRQCQNYAPPADQVVLETDPSAFGHVAMATGSTGRWRTGSYSFSGATLPVAVFQPDCWMQRRLSHGATGPMLRWDGATLFLHEMQRPNGEKILVHVEFAEYLASEGLHPQALEISTMTLGDDGQEWHTGMSDRIGPWLKVPPRLRVFAGQADSNNPSHFTIRYQMWGQEDVIDAVIEDHRIAYTQRNPPKEP